MKKKLVSGILMLAMVFSMTACTNKKTGENTVNGVVTERPEYPDVKALDYITLPKDYKNMTVEVEPKVTKVTDEDVDERIKQSLPTTEITPESKDEKTALAIGDTAVVDLNGTIDGAEFDGSTATDYSVTLGSNKLIKGFEDQMVGMSFDKHKVKKTIRIVFPETYSNEKLRDKMAEFEVTLKSFIHVTPVEKLTEDDIKDMSKDKAKTLSEYKDYVKDQIATENQDKYEDNCQVAMLDYLIKNSEVKDLPDSLYDWYYDSVYAVYADYAETYKISIENVFASNGIEGVKDKASFKEYAESYAKDAILGELIPQAIAEDMKISFTDKEYQAYLKEMMESRNYDKSAKEFEKAYKRVTIEHWCVNENVWKKLMETVKFKDKKEDDGKEKKPAIENTGGDSADVQQAEDSGNAGTDKTKDSSKSGK